MSEFDLVVIGGGSGGLACARRAALYGSKVAVVEAEQLGGTCVHRGCVPKKLFYQLAEFPELDKSLKEFSETSSVAEAYRLDYPKFQRLRSDYLQRLEAIYQGHLDKSGIQRISGFGELLEPGVVKVGEQLFRAKHILLATGSTPIWPTIDGAELGDSSDQFFLWSELPRSVAIVGAGYIALELASSLALLGVEVHLCTRTAGVLKTFDQEIATFTMAALQRHGVKWQTEFQVERLLKRENGLELHSTDSRKLEVERVIWAIGRNPQLNFKPEAASIAIDAAGFVKIDETLVTTRENHYAVGDLITGPALTPAAIAQGRALAEYCFNHGAPPRIERELVPTVIFTHPPVGAVGLSEEAAIARYGAKNLKIYRSQFNPLRYALLESKVPTLMKLICLADGEKILGIHLAGDAADEMLQGFAVAFSMGATKADFDRCLAIHPTSAEELVTMR